MELIKRNMVLFVVLGVALLVSIVLAIFVIQLSMSLKKHQENLLVQREKIKKLIEEKPAPLKGNLDAINSDIAVVQQKVNEIHLVFGKPYRSAIQAFAEALGVSENTLYTKWRIAYEREKKLGSPDQIFLKFMGDLLDDGKPKAPEIKQVVKKQDPKKADKEKAEEDPKKAENDAKKAEEDAKKAEEDAKKVENALLAFKTTFEKQAIEDVTQENINLLIMEGLGLSRSMSPEVCTAYVSSMDNRLTNFVKSTENNTLPIAIQEGKDKASMFTVIKGMPQPDRIPLILKHYRMLEDLVIRMKATKIKALNSLTSQSIDGIEGRGYLTLTYKMQVLGTMSSVRDFINNLQDAYKENRVYIVRDLSLKKFVDETKLIQTITSQPSGSGAVQPSVPAPARGAAADKTAKKEEAGSLVIGTSTDVVADLKIDYVIYIADEIKKR